MPTQVNRTASNSQMHNQSRTSKNNLAGGMVWPYLPLKLVNALEPLAEYYNVSHKARGLQKPTKSDKGFLTVYREAGGSPSKFEKMPVRSAKPDGENWQHHRADFCNRRYAMIKGKPGYGLYDEKTGLPSVMHVNMLMWACSPDASGIKKNWKTILAKLEDVRKPGSK
jgi:hypothetical protein